MSHPQIEKRAAFRGIATMYRGSDSRARPAGPLPLKVFEDRPKADRSVTIISALYELRSLWSPEG